MNNKFRIVSGTDRRSEGKDDVAPLTVDAIENLAKSLGLSSNFNGVLWVSTPGLYTETLQNLRDGFTILLEADKKDGAGQHYHFISCYKCGRNIYFLDPAGKGVNSMARRAERNDD
jgi:hypothetical protein